MTNASVHAAIPPDSVSLVECPKCGFQRYVEIDKSFRESGFRYFYLICNCGHSGSVSLETRKFRRHPFDACGSILIPREKGDPEKVRITVKDLSRSGVRFATENHPPLKIDEKIIISLESIDTRQTFFVKEAAIRNIKANLISAEFTSPCGNISLLKNKQPPAEQAALSVGKMPLFKALR